MALELDRVVDGETISVFCPTQSTDPWSSSTVRGVGTKLPSVVLAAGEYGCHVEGDGWAVLGIPLIVVPEGERFDFPVERTLHEHRVRFFQGGKPLARGEINIWKNSSIPCSFDLDENGWASIALDRGTFHVSDQKMLFVPEDIEPHTLVWPPAQDEFHLD